MFREMRRFKQQLTPQQCGRVLERGTAGVLAVEGDDGYPYAVPLSYVWADGTLWFHCAQSGHKLDALRRCAKASFCVVDQNQLVPETYTTYFRSVIVFGRVRPVEDPAEKLEALRRLAVRFGPADPPDSHKAELDKTIGRVCILALQPDHITGKEAVELTRRRAAEAPAP